jgi:hypothetical protein
MAFVNAKTPAAFAAAIVQNAKEGFSVSKQWHSHFLRECGPLQRTATRQEPH